MAGQENAKQSGQDAKPDDKQSASGDHGKSGKRNRQCQQASKNQLAANEKAGKCSNKYTQIQNLSLIHIFVVLMLCPIPLLFYIDSVQKYRYTRVYRIIESVALLNFVVETVLQVTGIADYIQTMPVDHVILAVTFVTIVATSVLEMCIRDRPRVSMKALQKVDGIHIVGLETVRDAVQYLLGRR